MRHLRFAAALAALLGPGAALADEAEAPADPPYAFGTVPGWTLMVGPTGGASFGSGGAGGFLGAELSVNRLSQATWSGLYLDGVYDFGRGDVVLTVGPQLGFTVVGLDGGFALRARDGEVEPGVAGRLVLSLVAVSLYGRYHYFADTGDHIGQVGLMFKLPAWASETGGDGR